MIEFPVGMVFVFFVYGLAFFSTRLAILLEVGRVPLLADDLELSPKTISRHREQIMNRS
jgi:hypothetical protein